MPVADSKHYQALDAEHRDIVRRFYTRRKLQDRPDVCDRIALIGGMGNA